MIPSEHQSYIDKAVTAFKADPRFLGLLGAGSLIEKRMDEFSDLDLVAVYKDDCADSVTKDRYNLLSQIGEVVSAFTGEHVGDPRVLICLFKNPLLHIDVKFLSISELSKRVENPVILFESEGAISKVYSESKPAHPMPDPQWIEDRFWTWIHYAGLRLGRGELFEVLDLLSFLRGVVFGPLILVKKGRLPRGVRRIEMYANDYSEALKKTVAVHDRNSCVNAIEASIELYLKLRQDHPHVKRNEDAEKLSVEYFRSVNLNF